MSITAVNTGHRAVEVHSPGFEMPDNRLFVMPLPRLSAKTPIRLEDGESAEFFYDHEKLKEAEKEHGRKLTYGYVLDAEGKVYRGDYKADHGV